MPAKEPAPNSTPTRQRPARTSATSTKRSQARKPPDRDGHVKAHDRHTKHGTVHVGAHDRSTRRTQWATAGNTWGGAAATGVLALGLVLQLSFTLIAAAAIILAVTVKVLVYLLTDQDLGQPAHRRRGRAGGGRHTKRRSTGRSTSRGRGR
ncbi:hypothetical protein ACFOY4_04970 [Actinomadura syzygii]|uniref:Uncharacterized protein n=1 Tax=Actinomadura syzygii TaxID=1427538 RepID=A0A5D0TV26_9ACTN|nr:hypothetical protein [Actinomadura syzygii]TYC10038.1 hypothetical protein FXF65_33640 [Actinomadura syzygii]